MGDLGAVEVVLDREQEALVVGQLDEPALGRVVKLVVPGDLTIQKNLREAGLWSFYEGSGFTHFGGAASLGGATLSGAGVVVSGG